ncbi:hypothetical protein CDAR_415241 [Caerostris darwini]|uniref:Uncharacterized protein n=1 Tax=Caerostris darwini TaxID=1538125 RepID=A0AAV4UDB1_9ARAC|nr:hypothetical protein CDAR_415241 [Caerostris darwini]
MNLLTNAPHPIVRPFPSKGDCSASFCATDAIFLCKRNKNCTPQRQIDGLLRMINNSGSNVFTTGGRPADQSEDAFETSLTSITLGA